MSRTTSAGVQAAITAAMVALLLGPTVPAAARIDLDGSAKEASAAGDVHPMASNGYRDCPLRRLGTQFVRCDVLTGAGAQAPLWVPEYESGSPEPWEIEDYPFASVVPEGSIS